MTHPILVEMNYYISLVSCILSVIHIVSYSVDNTIKLSGAGAFAFHPTLEWIFVGDRRGTLLLWDVSTERPNMLGM